MEMPYYTFLLLPLLYATYRLWRLGHRPKNYPPGPPTLPLLGNIHLMAKSNPHLQFQTWAQEYGPVYSLILGTKTMVVLSDDQAVKDLLDRKSANTSARPDLYTGQTLMSGGKRMVMMTYGAPWRTELENKQLLYDMMTDPSDLLEHFRRYSSSLVTSIVYGFRWPTFHDPLLQKLFHNLDNYVRLNMTGGAALADFFPILRYLPTWLSPHKREALAHYAHEIAMYTTLYQRVKSALLANPNARSCVCKDVIALQAQENYTDEYTSHIPGQLWEAGSDTTSTQLYGFIQALLLYPDIQAKGQAELDAIIGHDRMPTLDDMIRLPYVRACVKETLRWLPAAILGAFPHATSEDDMYMGYRIPKGAIIMLNTWTIHRDPTRYANPTVFNPDRFLEDTSSSAESATSIDVSRRDHFGFGAGRRICPGMNVADRSLLLGIARIFWAFDVKPKLGADGEAKMPVQDDFVPGFVAIPKPFDVVVTPRSEGKREIIRREWEMAKGDLGEDGQFLKGSVRMNGMK
ncbi:cytochrome P450 [Paraphoma chrysanthemicola]|nr:cytochrome P450 [Paraphoma chrysanthemicola]